MDVERLRTRLAQGVPIVLVALSGCAGIFGPTTATSFMHQIERDPDPNVRYKAYQSLGSARVYDDSEQRAAAAKLLLTKLDPRQEPLASRAVICRTLGEIGDPSARDAMARLVRDPDPLIRAEAYRALGKVGRREDSTVLMQAMTLDNDDHCKAAAIEALGSIKDVDPRTEGYLTRSLVSDDPRIRYASLKSLRKISGKDLGAKPGPWRAYVLAKHGEKIEPPADDEPGRAPLDRAAEMASLSASAPPASAPTDPSGVWNRNSEAGPDDAPYLGANTAPMPKANPGQTPLPAPPPAAPPQGILSKMFGY